MHRLGLLDQAFYKIETCGMSPPYMAGAMILDVTDSPFQVVMAFCQAGLS